MVKVARKIHLNEEGCDDVSYWVSRSSAERLLALEGMRRIYIKAYGASGDREPRRVYRIVKLKRGAFGKTTRPKPLAAKSKRRK